MSTTIGLRFIENAPICVTISQPFMHFVCNVYNYYLSCVRLDFIKLRLITLLNECIPSLLSTILLP